LLPIVLLVVSVLPGSLDTQALAAEARQALARPGVLHSKIEIVLPDGTVAVSAIGRYMKLPIDKIADGDFESEWFEDVREVPETVEL